MKYFIVVTFVTAVVGGFVGAEIVGRSFSITGAVFGGVGTAAILLGLGAFFDAQERKKEKVLPPAMRAVFDRMLGQGASSRPNSKAAQESQTQYSARPSTKDATNRQERRSLTTSGPATAQQLSESKLQPQDFLLKAYTVVIHHAFAEERLGGRYTAEILKLRANDTASLGKARVCAISMVLCLSYRAATEAFLEMYGPGAKSSYGVQRVTIAGAKLFESIVETEMRKASLPSYADSSYFRRWRMRYEKRILDTTSTQLKFAVLDTFFGHATFQYGSESAVNATGDLIIFYGDDVYDNYVIGLRNLLGPNVLR